MIAKIMFGFFLAAMGVGNLLAGPETSGIGEFRSIDGSGNNLDFPTTGTPDEPLIRLTPVGFGDGTDLPRGVPVEDEGNGNIEFDEQSLPSARLISNLVHDQDSDGDNLIFSARKLNQLFFQWGQFIDHDFGLTEPNTTEPTGGMTGHVGNEMFFIEVPTGDPDFGFSMIPLLRSIAKAPGEVSLFREQTNVITAFIDGSQVYGSDLIRADNLRLGISGRLVVEQGGNGDLMPLNSFAEENANPLGLPPGSMFLAGDVRSNEQVALTALHTVFVREHNRIADELALGEYFGADLTDPVIDEEIYQRARAAVGAIIQSITYYEWLPALFGDNSVGDYTGYKPWVDPQLSNVFSGAAFRIGHTMLPPTLFLTAADGSNTPLPLREAFFAPEVVTNLGVDPILRGLARHLEQEIDRFVVDDVRSFLFPADGGGLDLAAVNLQRGRDHGLPAYNDVRKAFKLPPADDYADISPDSTAQAALEAAYGVGNVDDVDIWSGGICEPHLPGGSIGETFAAIVSDQFARLRDGDRFFFLNDQIYPSAFIQSVKNTTLADVIRRNTGLGAGINDYSFFPPQVDPYQPDLRSGSKPNPASHQGDDRYNTNGHRQSMAMKTRRHRAAFCLSIENDGMFAHTIRTRLMGGAGRAMRCRVIDLTGPGKKNVTAAIRRGAFVKRFEMGDMRVLRTVLKKRGSSPKTAALRFRSESIGHGGAVDVNRAEVEFR